MSDPMPLADVARQMSQSTGPAELPVVFAYARFHAGRVWVAPLGANLGETIGDGAHPGPVWIEVEVP